MTDAELELARRLVAHPKWRWMEGMRWHEDQPRGCGAAVGRLDDGHIMSPGPEWPDLADPATQGCLFGMLGKKAWSLGPNESGWSVALDVDSPAESDHEGATRGEALARALLAAWGEG